MRTMPQRAVKSPPGIMLGDTKWRSTGGDVFVWEVRGCEGGWVERKGGGGEGATQFT